METVAVTRWRGWPPEADEALRVSMGDAAADIRAEVMAGVSDVWRIGETWAVTRVERIKSSAEMVIVCLEGKKSETATDVLYRVAQANGIGSIRFHTQRQSLARLVHRFGPVETERVYRVRVQRGQ